MTADRDLMVGQRRNVAGDHRERPGRLPEWRHRARGVLVERAMQPPDEVDEAGSGKPAGGVQAVNLALHPDMRPRLDLEVAALFVPYRAWSCSARSISRGVVLWPSIRLE